MSVVERVKAAQNPQEAMVALAAGIDLLLSQQPTHPEDPWGTWASEGAPAYHAAPDTLIPDEFEVVKVTETPDHIEVAVKAPSPEKAERRASFEAQSLKLGENLPAGEDWNAVYVKGGPLWLYHLNRDLFMSYPYSIRQGMVADIIEDDPKAAHEVGRDVLKQASETGPGSSAMLVGEGTLG